MKETKKKEAPQVEESPRLEDVLKRVSDARKKNNNSKSKRRK